MTTPPPKPFQHAGFSGRIGVARTDITPPVGIYSRNWGAANHDVADAIHRPLTLSALVLSEERVAEKNALPLILIDADLGWWKTPQTWQWFQARLLSALRLPAENVIFALSHTHAGPPLMDIDDSLPGSQLIGPWMEELFAATVNTVEIAIASQFHGTLDWQMGRCGLANVRDLPDPDTGRDRVLCGFAPETKADDTLLLGRISDASGTLRATLVNYACHPTTLAWDNTAISPDYPGAMRATMQDVTAAPSLFLLGACGDLAPRFQYVGDTSVADRHGRQLAHAALATLNNMEPAGTRLAYSHTVESGAPLAVWRHETLAHSSCLSAHIAFVELPLKDWPTADELEHQRLACTDRALEERLRRKRDIRRSLGDGSTYGLPLYAWRLGEAVLVGSCCEPYSLLQVNVRQRFPDRTIICMNLINGSIGYLPPAELYDTDVYPVWQTPFDRGSLELVLSEMEVLIEQLLSQPLGQLKLN